MIRIIVYSLAAMLGLFSSPIWAEGGEYQIELIVFSQAMPNTEVFDQTSGLTQWPSDLTELSAYRKPENTTLDDSYAALSKDSAYRLILYAAWIQPVAEGGGVAPVHIQSSDGKLNGYLQIQRGQSLQLLVDVEYAPGHGNSAGETSNSVGETYDVDPIIFRLNEKRPIKPGEVYYLDHPKFGIVAKVSPL